MLPDPYKKKLSVYKEKFLNIIDPHPDHWCLKNYVFAISLPQFKSLTTQFREALKEVYKTPFDIDITLMMDMPVSLPLAQVDCAIINPNCDRDERIKRYNIQNIVLKTNWLDKVTPDFWEEIKCTSVAFTPTQKSANDNLIGATLLFGGNHPKRATFHIIQFSELDENGFVSDQNKAQNRQVCDILGRNNRLMRMSNGRCFGKAVYNF